MENEVAEVAVACFHRHEDFLIPEMSFLDLFSTKVTSAETRPITLQKESNYNMRRENHWQPP